MADLLDLLDLIADEAPATPTSFTLDESWTPDQLQAGYEKRCKRAELEPEGTLGIRLTSHCWALPYTQAGATRGAHPIQVVSAHLGCPHRHGEECQCVGRADPIVYRAYCDSCRYWTPVSVDENGAAETIHDHCWPGWRELPIGTDASRDEHWSQPGAPVITARSRYGTRHVPGRSPYGGYDLSDHVAQGGSGE